MNKVFIGYDPREDIAYQVCKYSIQSRNPTIDVEPLIQKDLRDNGWYWRAEDKLGSTEFTFTRFLVPELMYFDGWAVFMDCDMILQTDIEELFKQADDQYAVMVAKHDYTPKPGMKMDNKTQHPYPRKNWSSVMMFNCSHPSNQKLTADLVNHPETTGKYLHRFSWLEDHEIGEISHEWNWLVGWYKESTDGNPKCLHYTEGGPWFENYRTCPYNREWKNELYKMLEVKTN